MMFCLFSIIEINTFFSISQQSKTVGSWTIQFDPTKKTIDFIKENKLVLANVLVKAKVDNREIISSDYSEINFSTVLITDEIGEAQKYIIEYVAADKPTIQQIFYLYNTQDFFISQVVLSSPRKIQSNYIAPIYTEANNTFLPQSEHNRLLTIPYDNEGFITYGSYPLTRDSLSFEVTSIFNGDSQNGLVVGSVEHNIWKSAIRIKSSNHQNIHYLECYNGVTHQITRDEITRDEYVGKDEKGEDIKAINHYLIPHGTLRDNIIFSSRFMVGFFDDWRIGLETYGEVNEKIAPKRKWDTGVPFGWNSWGYMKESVNYNGVISVSDFIKDNLQGDDFNKENLVYIGLDANNFSDRELQEFADHCYSNGQIPGYYLMPFLDWGGYSRPIEGSIHNYKDTWMVRNGVVTHDMDPTHPGTLDRIKFHINRIKGLGFRYIKLDFMCTGAKEADYFYDRNTTTGIQAYNYAMKYIKEIAGDDMFITLAMSPVFPAQYVHARRISCDSWGEMWHTQYMMNSLSYGWWLDRVYVYNDPDHLVLVDWNEGENRARMTSGAITGLYLLGDNVSDKGTALGTDKARQKVLKFATNPYINKIARMKKSFRPAYGHKQSSVSGAVDLFTCETDTHYYIVYFNYGGPSKIGELDLESLGIDMSIISGGRECWTKIATTITDGKLRYSVPGSDVRVYMLEKTNVSSIPHFYSENKMIISKQDVNKIVVKNDELFNEVAIVALDGSLVLKKNTADTNEYNLSLESFTQGVYLISIITKSGNQLYQKYINQ